MEPTKKRKPINLKQYEPFTDFQGLTTKDFQGVDVLKAVENQAEMIRIINNSRWKDSLCLSILVETYLDTLKKQNPTNAIAAFWDAAAKYKGTDILTEPMWNTLEAAFRGEVKAIQIMVRANPDTMHLPFVASRVAEIIRGAKYGLTKKDDSGQSEILRNKTLWNDFLPKRSGGDYPFDNPDYIKGLFDLEKQESGKVPHGKSGRFAESDRIGLAEKLSKKLRLSPDTILKKAKLYKKRGRPRK